MLLRPGTGEGEILKLEREETNYWENENNNSEISQIQSDVQCCISFPFEGDGFQYNIASWSTKRSSRCSSFIISLAIIFLVHHHTCFLR